MGGSDATGAANPMAGLMGMDPAQMNQMMQMAGQMFGQQPGGEAGAGGAGAPNMMSMMANHFGQQGGQGGAAAPNFFGGSQASAAPSSPQQQMSPEARFAVQLQQLNDTGFNDQEANIRCLTATAGNVNAAIERILGGQ